MIHYRPLVWCSHSNNSTCSWRMMGPHSSILKSINRFRIVQCLSSISAIENHLVFQLAKDFVHEFFFTNLLRVLHCARRCTDCSIQLGTRLRQSLIIPFMSRVSRPMKRSKKLSNHARCCVVLQESNVQFSRGWWMELCSGYVQHKQLDVRPCRRLHPVKNVLETFQWCERALHERIFPPEFSSHKS